MHGMSTSTPVPGPHLHPSTRPAKPAHTRPADPSFTRLQPFAIVDLPAGAARQVGAKFTELAVDLDELDPGSVGELTDLALSHLQTARFYALLALGVDLPAVE